MQLISTEYISYILTPDCHESGSLEASYLNTKKKSSKKTTSGKWRKGREEGQLLPPTSFEKKSH